MVQISSADFDTLRYMYTEGEIYDMLPDMTQKMLEKRLVHEGASKAGNE